MDGQAELAKSWTLVFTGNAETAARRVKKSLLFLRRPRGSIPAWEELWATTPDGEAIRAYAGYDKNLRMLLVEQATTKLGIIVRRLYPGKNWFVKKVDGIISVGWDKVGNVEITDARLPSIKFNEQMVARHSVIKEDVRAELESSWAPSAGEVQWSL